MFRFKLASASSLRIAQLSVCAVAVSSSVAAVSIASSSVAAVSIASPSSSSSSPSSSSPPMFYASSSSSYKPSSSSMPSSLSDLISSFSIISACDSSNNNNNNNNNSSNSNSSSKKPLQLTSVPEVTLYQYKICPYCNRVKALLDFLEIKYTAIEVNPLTKSELSSFAYKKVPIAKINGDVVIESKPIFDCLVSFIDENEQKRKFFGQDTEKWAEWSDRRLAVYLYPNLTSTLEASYESFSYTSEVKQWNVLWQVVTRCASSVAMWAASGRIKSKYNIKDEVKELDTEIQVWLDALGDKKFLQGDSVSMSDLLVFGVLKAVEGLSVQSRLFARFPVLGRWYDDVEKTIRKGARKPISSDM